jgi:hypothetical protein
MQSTAERLLASFDACFAIQVWHSTGSFLALGWAHFRKGLRGLGNRHPLSICAKVCPHGNVHLHQSDPESAMELRQRIWNAMGAERRRSAAQTFWSNPEQKMAQRTAEAVLAKRLKARPVFLQRLPPEKKAAYLAQEMAMNPEIWDAVMVSYHLTAHRPMLAEFLDALGIKNKDGHLETAEGVQPPSSDALEGAVHGLTQKYPKLDVLVYLAALLLQDAGFWKNLAPIVNKLESELKNPGD